MNQAKLQEIEKNDNFTFPLTEKERKQLHREQFEEQIRQTKIRQSICPVCNNKLVRGKRDKKKDYKRLWDCLFCNKTHFA